MSFSLPPGLSSCTWRPSCHVFRAGSLLRAAVVGHWHLSLSENISSHHLEPNIGGGLGAFIVLAEVRDPQVQFRCGLQLQLELG